MNEEQVEHAVKSVLSKLLIGEQAAKGKEFYIPLNVDPKTKVWGIYLQDYVFLIPSFALLVFMFFFKVNVILQVGIDLIFFMTTIAMITIRPLRPEIPAWKHIGWLVRYDQRQRRFFYKKGDT